jgi:peptidoglycan hydrolase-like protein with peptidoglycan-binding domain
MPARNIFGPGAIGETIKHVQVALVKAGFDTKGTDGWYGQNTSAAVGGYQQSESLPSTGLIDETSWQLLMQSPVPSVADRSLQLTASFEGHGFGLAVGNFDGALLTWGIIGFTLASGEIQQIMGAVDQAHPQLIQEAFQSFGGELLSLIEASRDFQTDWANRHTLGNGALAEPWRGMFFTFGSFPEVQAEQMNHVTSDYLNPGIQTAKMLNLSSELGLALCFDIHVQDGGIKLIALDKIQQQVTPNMTEATLRVIVANAVADSVRPAFREDVRRRKLTIAMGQGVVHGHSSHSHLARELVPTLFTDSGRVVEGEAHACWVAASWITTLFFLPSTNDRPPQKRRRPTCVQFTPRGDTKRGKVRARGEVRVASC